MTVYVYRDGRMVEKATGEPMNPGPHEGPFPCPRAIPDIEPFISPASGKIVSGRAAKRDDLRATGCVDARELPQRESYGKLTNKAFAKRRGLEHLLHDSARD
jgi:hypothetical protein